MRYLGDPGLHFVLLSKASPMHWTLQLALSLSSAVFLLSAPPASAESKDTLTIDLVADVSTMDPQLQWDTDAYSVYRNIFDNLLTRDTSGKIVPQVATAWHYASDTAVVFDLRHD